MEMEEWAGSPIKRCGNKGIREERERGEREEREEREKRKGGYIASTTYNQGELVSSSIASCVCACKGPFLSPAPPPIHIY